MAPATIRAKFHCYASDENGNGDEVSVSVRLRPVYGDAPENKSFSKFTPSGDLSMLITNQACLGFFITGQDYYLDLTPVPAVDNLLADEAPVRIAKAADDLPDLPKDAVVAEVKAQLPEMDTAHVEAGVQGHADAVESGVTDPATIAAQAHIAAAKAGATETQALTIATAIPAAVEAVMAAQPVAEEAPKPLPQDEVEVSPVLPKADVVAAVQAALPDQPADHIAAAVDGHMDEVAKATEAGVEPDNAVVHQAATAAAQEAGAEPLDAADIAAAIPPAVASLTPASDDSGTVEDTDEEKAAKDAAADAVARASAT